MPSGRRAAGLTRRPGTAHNGEMDIGIHSGIDPTEKEKRDTDPAYAQDPAKCLRVFFLASVKEEVWDEKLVHPVDAHAIAKDLTAQLIAQGFIRCNRIKNPRSSSR